MITADKVFKGSNEIIRIYRGSTLEWEKLIDVPTYSWNPTTYIRDFGYYETLSGKETGSVTLTLPPNVGVVSNKLYFSTNVNQEDQYIKEYALDSTSTVKCSLDYDYNEATRSLYCIQYPGNAEVHTIYFKAYGGYYGSYNAIFEVNNPRLIYHPSQIQSTYTKRTILFDTNGVWTYNIYPDHSDNWTSDFQIQGAGTYKLRFNMTSYVDEKEYAPCKLYICDLDSDTIKQTLNIHESTGGSSRTGIITFTPSDDNRHTIKIGGEYTGWGGYTVKISVSSITNS